MSNIVGADCPFINQDSNSGLSLFGPAKGTATNPATYQQQRHYLIWHRHGCFVKQVLAPGPNGSDALLSPSVIIYSRNAVRSITTGLKADLW